MSRRVSRRAFWRAKYRKARGSTAKLAAAHDYLRAMAANHPNRDHADEIVKQHSQDMYADAEKLAREVPEYDYR